MKPPHPAAGFGTVGVGHKNGKLSSHISHLVMPAHHDISSGNPASEANVRLQNARHRHSSLSPLTLMPVSLLPPLTLTLHADIHHLCLPGCGQASTRNRVMRPLEA